MKTIFHAKLDSAFQKYTRITSRKKVNRTNKVQIFLEVIFEIEAIHEPNSTYEAENNPIILRNDFIIKGRLIYFLH